VKQSEMQKMWQSQQAKQSAAKLSEEMQSKVKQSQAK
jgi:hypothetical protein